MGSSPRDLSRVALARRYGESALRSSLAGSRAGRGFRYQDAVAAYLATQAVVEGLSRTVLPEAGDDVTLIEPTQTVHLQIRSRRGRRGELTGSDIAAWLVELLERHGDSFRNDLSIRLGLAVDRSTRGIDETEFHRTLDQQGSEPLRELLERRMPEDLRPDQLLERSHLLVIAEPTRLGTELLAEHLSIAPAAALLVFREIQSRMGEIARLARRAPMGGWRGSSSDTCCIRIRSRARCLQP